MSIGVGVKPAEALSAPVQFIISWRKSAQRPSSLRVSMCLRSVGEPDPDAKVFRENLLRLLLVGLDHAFPQERVVLKVSRQVGVEQPHEVISMPTAGSEAHSAVQTSAKPSPRCEVITGRSALGLQSLKSIQYQLQLPVWLPALIGD